MFQLRAVRKSYPGTVALDGIDLSIAKGETVALVGPSGAGKTTLLNVMASLTSPDTGEVTIDGRPARSLPAGKALARRVGVMHQQFALVDQLPVIHNVLAGRLGEWSFWKSALSLIVPRERQLAQAALERVGIADKMYERTLRLSGGEQQRVALARLLVQQPQAILADEPVASLDPARASDLLSMLVDLSEQEGLTLVSSLHSVESALRFFQRIVALRGGQIVFDQPRERVTEAQLEQLYDLKQGNVIR